MGTFRHNSDIDLVVKGAGVALRDVIRLRGKLEELPLPYTFDIVGFGSVANPALLEHIVKHGEVLYPRKESIERVSDGDHGAYGGNHPGETRE